MGNIICKRDAARQIGRARNVTRTFMDPDLQKWWEAWVETSTPARGTARSRSNSPVNSGTRTPASSGVWKVIKDGGFWKEVLQSFIIDAFWGAFLFYWNVFVIWRDTGALYFESIWFCLMECLGLRPDGSYSVIRRPFSRRGWVCICFWGLIVCFRLKHDVLRDR
ncbi:hypothetical protein EAF04_004545 [Stromatinia cepivora]|nr:hypothetical protein EAF04_004545 [Stromatinia cepivora]